MVDGELKLDGPVTIQISEDTYERLSDIASDYNIGLDEAVVVAVNKTHSTSFLNNCGHTVNHCPPRITNS